jgi:hypothetical protein
MVDYLEIANKKARKISFPGCKDNRISNAFSRGLTGEIWNGGSMVYWNNGRNGFILTIPIFHFSTISFFL